MAMSSFSKVWALAVLLIATVKATFDDHDGTYLNHSTTWDPTCTGDVTFIDTTTITSSATHYVDVCITTTKTSTVQECVTKYNTTTLYYTVSITETDLETITDTETTTTIVPATITTYTTQTETVLSTVVDPCPTTCSISAGTVSLFFWPTDRPYTYPPTYVDEALGYTFISPSVYMLIPTAKGTNSLGPAGPSTSDWMIPLDLEEVSTIIDETVTRQLTLNDLGTDCPRTADPTAIATLDSRCNPILAAPTQVSSWAYPCNACGRFGLFDPPYAIPTVTGGLLETTTVVPPPVSTPPVGVILIIHYVDGEAVSTETIPTTGLSGTSTSTVNLSLPSSLESTDAPTSTTDAATITSPSEPTVVPTTPPQSTPSTVPTGAASRISNGSKWWSLSTIFVLLLV